MSLAAALSRAWDAVRSLFSPDPPAGAVAPCPYAGSRVPGMKAADADAAIDAALADQKAMLESRLAEIKKWDEPTRARAREWFGDDSAATQKVLQERTEKLLELNKGMTRDNFAAAEGKNADQEGLFAYVYPNQPDKVYLGRAFADAPPTGANSRAGTLSHEMSHYVVAGGTDDHAYGPDDCRSLAKADPASALNNADNYEYFME
jgi:peptidyl-Lys metalloendopeptidase